MEEKQVWLICFVAANILFRFQRGQLVKFTLKTIANGGVVINKGTSRDLVSKKSYVLLSQQLVWLAENPKNLENEISGKEDSAEKVERGDLVADKESDSTDQLVVPPPWENIDNEVLKDVFRRFGSVKVIYLANFFATF